MHLHQLFLLVLSEVRLALLHALQFLSVLPQHLLGVSVGPMAQTDKPHWAGRPFFLITVGCRGQGNRPSWESTLWIFQSILNPSLHFTFLHVIVFGTRSCTCTCYICLWMQMGSRGQIYCNKCKYKNCSEMDKLLWTVTKSVGIHHPPANFRIWIRIWKLLFSQSKQFFTSISGLLLKYHSITAGHNIYKKYIFGFLCTPYKIILISSTLS